MRADLGRREGGSPRIVDGLSDVPKRRRRQVVVDHVRSRYPVPNRMPPLQGLGHAQVKARGFERRQVLEQDAPNQVVAKFKVPRALLRLDDDLAVARTLEKIEKRVRLVLGDMTEQAEIEFVAHDRSGRKQLRRFRALNEWTRCRTMSSAGPETASSSAGGTDRQNGRSSSTMKKGFPRSCRIRRDSRRSRPCPPRAWCTPRHRPRAGDRA